LVSFLDVGSAALVPSLVVLVIGFLVGVVIKKTVKLGLAILSLIGVLAALGYINLHLNGSSPETIYRVASYAQPFANQAVGVASILPITSAAFLVGLALGILKG
jgi:uncharacterized membrane protein (Fun14 family)